MNLTTSIYIALLGVMLIGISLNVIRARHSFGTGIGDAQNIEMQRRIRAQANFTEYTPIFLIMLGYAEYGGLRSWAIHALGVAFLMGRLIHAYSLLKHEKYNGQKLTIFPAWRILGMICTFTVMGLLAIILLVQNIT